MNLPDDILIVGLGITGVATARFLGTMGKRLTVVDEKTEQELEGPLRALDGLRFTGIFGPHREENFLDHPLIVVSPGVDSELPGLKAARAKGIKII